MASASSWLTQSLTVDSSLCAADVDGVGTDAHYEEQAFYQLSDYFLQDLLTEPSVHANPTVELA